MTTKQAKSETLSEAKAPERIYLQWFGVDAADVTPEELAIQPSPGDLTWCTDKQFDTDVEYIRADVGRLQGLEEAARAICEWCAQGSQADSYPRKPYFWHAIGSGNVPCTASAIREKIKVGAQEENAK